MDQMPDAHEMPAAGPFTQTRDRLRDVASPKIHPADDTCHEIALRRDLQQLLRFIERIDRLDHDRLSHG